MGHYIGPKARVNRRLGLEVYDSSGAVRAGRRRQSPPGMHGARRRRPTDFGRALVEKQKIRFYYGLSQRQLRRFFEEARRMEGNKGENLLKLCERRLDSVIWRAGFARTRSQARQFVAHGHYNVNGRRTKVASHIIRAGDTIQVRGRPNLQKLYSDVVGGLDRPRADYLAVEPKELVIKVMRLPEYDDVSLPVNINQVVEHLSR